MALTEDDWNGQSPLPKQIVLTNGEVFVRRRVPKFLSFPKVNSDEIGKKLFAEILLFRYNENFELLRNLTSEQIEQLFLETDIWPLVDGLGNPMTKIETIKHRLRNTMCEVNFDMTQCNEFVSFYFDF